MCRQGVELRSVFRATDAGPKVVPRRASDEEPVWPRPRHERLQVSRDSFGGPPSGGEDACLLGSRNRTVPVPTHLFHRRRERNVVELNGHCIGKSPRANAEGPRLAVPAANDAAENHLRIVQMDAHFARKVDDASDRLFVADAFSHARWELHHEWNLVGMKVDDPARRWA